MTTATATDERHHNPPTRSIQDAIQDLVKSCGIHDSDGQGPSTSRFTEVQQACKELREELPFDSEEGRHVVIGKLTKLHGNYVVKIVRRGLCSLSKVYSSDTKTFENEATNLVKLCCLQYSMQTDSEGGHQIASPVNVIDWTVELCDELTTPSNDNLSHKDENASFINGPFLVNCLAKLEAIYKSIMSGRMKVLGGSGLDRKVMNPFKSIFDALKPRIKFKGFEELIEQTAAIVRTEENLDFMNFSSTGIPKTAILLQHWVSLLKYPFVTNWFAFKTAKHDFLVQDGGYAQSLPFSDGITYFESLIVQVERAFNFLITSNEQYQLSCDKTKLQVFFDNSEALLRHTIPCLHLMQTDVETSLVKEIFLLLQIKLNRDLLPRITDSEKKQCQPVLDALQKIILSPDHLHLQAMMEAANAEQVFQMKNLNHLCTSRPHQTASFDAITRALVALPDKQQVLKILQIWKKHFPDDINSYLMLSELFALVNAIIQTKNESVSSDMEKFIAFLLQLSPDFFSTLRIWRPLVEHLLVSLPHSCDGPEVVNLIRIFVDLHFRNAPRCSGQDDGAFVQKVLKIQKFLFLHGELMKQNSKSEEVKIKSLKLGLELFEEVPHPEEYEFVLNVILSTASDTETSGVKTFTLSLLKTARAHITRIQYPEIWEVISLIDQSRSIRRKCEIYNSYLEVLRETTADDVVTTVCICRDFLKSSDSINSDNTKRFFALAAKGRIATCQFVLECLFFNQAIICGERANEYIVFLLTIVEKTLSSDRMSCQLFFKTIHDYLQLQLLAYGLDTFEMIVALIAGSIAMGTFERDLNEVVLSVLLNAVHIRQLDNRAVILITYFYLSQILRQTSVEKGKRCMKLFAEGVRFIMRLPLHLQKTKWIIQKVISILDKEKITNEESVWSVMCHLFKMGDGSCTAIDPSDLESHFRKVMKPSVIRNTARILLLFRQKENILSGADTQIPLDSVFSLSDMLVERMPNTFAKKTSAELFKFIVKRVEKNQAISLFILPVAEAIIKVNVSEYELKTEIEEIEETFMRVQPQLVPIIAKCLRQYYLLDVSENKNIKVFILKILECFRIWKMNLEDTHDMIASILNIPKQLVLVFQRASNEPGVVKDMARVFDVATKVDRVIFNGQFLLHFAKEIQGRLTELIQHDFFMVLTKLSLVVSDACTILEFYRHLKPEDLLTVLTLSRNFDAKKGNSNAFWLTEYSRHSILTPGNLVYLILLQLRRIRIPKSDVREKALAICSHLLINYSLNCQVPCNCLLETTFEEYIESFFLVINQVSSVAEIEHWLTFLPHHAVQSRNVIVAACSWKASSESRKEVGRMFDGVSKALLRLLADASSGNGMFTPSCYATFTREIEVMALVLSTAEDEEIANNLLNLVFTSRDLTEACLGVVRSWSKNESLAFIEKMKQLYEERNKDLKKDQVDSEIATPLQILPFEAKAFPNSTDRVVKIFTTITEMGGGPEDPLSLGRLPVWYKQMADAGYDPQVIESWCTSLLHSHNLCSSDVDAITNINPEMIKVLNKDSGDEVGRCLFSNEAPKTWKSDGETDKNHRTNLESFKCCLLLARFLNELAGIGGCLKEKPNVVQKVRQCTTSLCVGFLDKNRSSGNLYKVRYCLLNELFVFLFGEDNGAEKEQPMMQDIMAHKSVARSLLILFRRLARSFASRPTLLGIVRGILCTIQKHVAENPNVQCQEVQGVIHETILNLEPNQDAMQTLQAAGYNQCTSPMEDLWYSSSIQMSAYITLIASDESLQLERSLRQLWIEWRDILSENKISEIALGEEKVKTTELFKPSDSLETIESHLLSVKQATKSLPNDNWSSYRRRQLIRNEIRLRNSIGERKDQVRPF